MFCSPEVIASVSWEILFFCKIWHRNLTSEVLGEGERTVFHKGKS